MRVDFPTFGLPTIFTKPDLCDIDLNCGYKGTKIKGGNEVKIENEE